MSDWMERRKKTTAIQKLYSGIPLVSSDVKYITDETIEPYEGLDVKDALNVVRKRRKTSIAKLAATILVIGAVDLYSSLNWNDLPALTPTIATNIVGIPLAVYYSSKALNDKWNTDVIERVEKYKNNPIEGLKELYT